MDKSPDAFRSIGEVARIVGVAPHVLRYWESQFTQLSPVKRRDGRRYYRPDDLYLVAGLVGLLREDGLTIRGAKKVLSQDRGAAARARGLARLQDTDISISAGADAPNAAPQKARKSPARKAPPRKPRKAAPPQDMPLFADLPQSPAPAGPQDTPPPAPSSAAQVLPMLVDATELLRNWPPSTPLPDDLAQLRSLLNGLR